MDWRLVFLVSVPIGLFGTVWAYLMLKEMVVVRERARLDILGNLLFAGGLTIFLAALTWGILPFGTAKMGWGNPLVVAGLLVGAAMLVVFFIVEGRIPQPMFHLELFNSRMFTMANLSGFLAAIARGGLMFMLIIWLQGIWLPIHGFSFDQTPLWSGIYLIPMSLGFLLMGPLSGALSDRYGAREFATGGMVLNIIGFVLLAILPYNFVYLSFALILFLIGIGQGMFSAPNTTSIMNALVSSGIPSAVAAKVAQLPPTAALFAAFLGYNPMRSLIPGNVLSHLSTANRANLLSTGFFPHAIAPAFVAGLHNAFYLAVGLSAAAAVFSFLRGPRYIHELDGQRRSEDDEEES